MTKLEQHDKKTMGVSVPQLEALGGERARVILRNAQSLIGFLKIGRRPST